MIFDNQDVLMKLWEILKEHLKFILWKNIFTSGFQDILAGKHYLYLTSSNFGSYIALGPRGDRNIIKKVAITANYA